MRREDDVIDLRGDGAKPDDAEFRINRKSDYGLAPAQSAIASEVVQADMNPNNKVKVKFDKFVNLIASRANDSVFDAHMDEDIIVSTDLLTDLASAQEEKKGNKMPVIFLFGILLGIGLAWILLRT